MKCLVEGGKVVTDSLEFFLADTCNLSCEHCASSAPYLNEPNFPDLAQFGESLSHLARVMRSRQIKFLGGEPLLNREIPRFLASARASGMFERVRVTTNGHLLERAGDGVWSSADVVEVSRYAGVKAPLSAETLARLRATATRSGAALEIVDHPVFFAALVDERIPDPEIVRRIYAKCGEAHSAPCHTLYRGRLYRCSRVHTLDRRLTGLGVEHAPFTETDGIKVDAGLTMAALRDYLESPRPLSACDFCLGTSGRHHTQRQLASGTSPSRIAFEPGLTEDARGAWARWRDRLKSALVPRAQSTRPFTKKAQ
jgi:organic radical activating enzyme